MALQSRLSRALLGPKGEDVYAGNLEVRLANSPQEVDAAQALRYRVFYEEMGAKPTDAARAERRDRDRFDAYCDHLLVIDHGRGDDRGDVVLGGRVEAAVPLRRGAADEPVGSHHRLRAAAARVVADEEVVADAVEAVEIAPLPRHLGAGPRARWWW